MLMQGFFIILAKISELGAWNNLYTFLPLILQFLIISRIISTNLKFIPLDIFRNSMELLTVLGKAKL